MRALFRLLLIVILVVGVGFLVLGYWAGSSWGPNGTSDSTTGTTGAIDTDRAREAGAEVGERVAVAGSRLKEEMSEATLTGKIKAKMALDDAIRARTIDVTTSGTVVTLSGTVQTADERERALRLARETEGVTSVVDHLTVR